MTKWRGARANSSGMTQAAQPAKCARSKLCSNGWGPGTQRRVNTEHTRRHAYVLRGNMEPAKAPVRGGG